MAQHTRTHQRIYAYILIALCALLTAACQTDIAVTLHDDDTYDFQSDMVIPRDEKSDYSCETLKQDLGTGARSSQIIIKDTSDARATRCSLSFTQAQPITSAKPPFIALTRKNDIFTARLEPITELEGLNTESIEFSLTVTFPGTVLKATGPHPHISNNSVTWHDTSVLYQGFTAQGRAYSGMRIWKRALLVFFIVLCLTATAGYALRRTATMQNIFAWIRQVDNRHGRPLYKTIWFIATAYYRLADRIYAWRVARRRMKNASRPADLSKNPVTTENNSTERDESTLQSKTLSPQDAEHAQAPQDV